MLLNKIENQILTTPNNLYISPHKKLRPYISAYNIVFPDQNMLSEKYTLIPDASGTLSFLYDGENITGELWGAATQPNMIGNEANNYKLLILVELNPGGLYQFTGVEQKEFVDMRVRLDAVDKTLNTMLCNLVNQSSDCRDLVNRLNMIFLSRLENVYRMNTILDLTRKIILNHGNLSIKELSLSEYYSERHLNRLFCQYIGMNVKLFSRIVRINHVLEQLQKHENSFALVANMAGFYDQSHFINDFKDLCGVPPILYFQNMSDFSNKSFIP